MTEARKLVLFCAGMGGAGPIPPPRAHLPLTAEHSAPSAAGPPRSWARCFALFIRTRRLTFRYAGLRVRRSGPLPRPVSAPSLCLPIRRERFPDIPSAHPIGMIAPRKYRGPLRCSAPGCRAFPTLRAPFPQSRVPSPASRHLRSST